MTELQFDSNYLCYVTEKLLDKIAAVHPDAIVAWDRDVSAYVRTATYLSFSPGYFWFSRNYNPRVFIGSVEDRESWFEWEYNSMWCFHQAEKTRTQILKEQK